MRVNRGTESDGQSVPCYLNTGYNHPSFTVTLLKAKRQGLLHKLHRVDAPARARNPGTGRRGGVSIYRRAISYVPPAILVQSPLPPLSSLQSPPPLPSPLIPSPLIQSPPIQSPSLSQLPLPPSQPPPQQPSPSLDAAISQSHAESLRGSGRTRSKTTPFQATPTVGIWAASEEAQPT